jgi:hypothetical protein
VPQQESAPNLPPSALSDSEIGRLWAKHFATHRDNPDSCQICFGICAIIEADAARLNTPIRSERIDEVLKTVAIRREKFDQVKAEKTQVDAQGLLYPKPRA